VHCAALHADNKKNKVKKHAIISMLIIIIIIIIMHTHLHSIVLAKMNVTMGFTMRCRTVA
jgi:hypothetical protein